MIYEDVRRPGVYYQEIIKLPDWRGRFVRVEKEGSNEAMQ